MTEDKSQPKREKSSYIAAGKKGADVRWGKHAPMVLHLKGLTPDQRRWLRDQRDRLLSIS